MVQRFVRLLLYFFAVAGLVSPVTSAYQPLAAFLGVSVEKEFLVDQVIWESDAPADTDELSYRAGIRAQQIVSRALLHQSVADLSSRPRYKEVSLWVKSHKNNERVISIKYVIKNHWRVEKVSIYGIHWGKPAFLDLYKIQQGEVFDAARHDESIKLITQQLANEGYCDAVVTEELEYRSAKKSIRVALKIHRGQKTVIRQPAVVVSFAKDHDEEFKGMFERLAASMLEGHNFSKKNLKAFVKQAYAMARDRGYGSARLTIDSFDRREKREITFTARIQVGEHFSLSFSGNRLFTSAWLKDQFLGTKYPEWLVVPELIAEQIKLEYRKRGYFDAEVTYQSLDTPGAYHFSITEGECSILRGVTFINKDLEPLIIPEKLLKKHPLNRACGEKQIKHLIFDVVTYLKSQGYWDCCYVSRKLEGTKKPHDVMSLITLNTGKQRLLKEVTIPGFEDLLEKPFFEKYRTASFMHAPFNDRWISEQKNYLLNYFHERGFWYALVEPQLVTESGKEGALLVSLHWRLSLGEPVTLGKIYVEGSSRLSHRQIQRFMRCSQGDVWTPSTVATARKRLKDSGLFKSVSVQSPSGKGHQKPLLVNVIDDDPYELLLRIGYFVTPNKTLPENRSTYKAGMSFNVKNPFNQGDKFSFKGDFSLFDQLGKISYSIPPWSRAPLSFTAEASVEKHKEYISVWGSDDHYHTHKKAFSLLWDYERHQDFHVMFHHGIENVSFKPSIPAASFAEQFLIDKELFNRSILGLFFEQRLLIDATDDHFNPSRGDVLSLSARFFAPTAIGVTSSLKLLYEHAFYVPLKQQAVLALRLRGGYLLGKPLHKALPSERFFLGGHTTVRGYDQDAVPPVSKVTRNGADIYTAHGGIGMLTTNAEFRLPIYGPLGGVVFQDIGFLTKENVSELFRNARPTTGLGFRYQSPLGAIRFDVGWKWRKAFSDETRYTWYLTIGHAF